MLRTSGLRTSGFLAIALSASALISVTVPASAGPSKVFGSVQPSQEAIHELGPKKVFDPAPKIPTPAKPVYSGLSPDGKLIPAKTTDICATHPYLQFCHQDPGPPKPPPPWPPHCEAGGTDCKPLPTCGLNGSLCKDGKKDDDKDEHHRPVVIFAPQVPVQVPVYVPGPYVTSPRVVTGVSSAPAVRPQPVITPTCMTAADIPALAAGIDQLLPTAQLAEANMKQVVELRQTIQLLATDGKVPAARDTEEIAMNILGYQKVWLRCGQGVFDWEPLPVPTQAQATQAR